MESRVVAVGGKEGERPAAASAQREQQEEVSESLPRPCQLASQASKLPARTWAAVRALAALEPVAFAELPCHMAEHVGEWCMALAMPDMEGRSVAEDPQNLCVSFPEPWCSLALSRVNKLLLVRAVRPLRLRDALRLYVQQTLGAPYVDLPPTTMQDACRVSSSRVPVLIVLDPGGDPAAGLGAALAERRAALGAPAADGAPELRTLSLGRGQEGRVDRLLEEGAGQPHWVLLLNCHTASSSLSRVERFAVETLESAAACVHRDFRLFLACPTSDHLPTALLLNCTKVALEPPRGIRASFRQAVGDIDMDVWERCPDKAGNWRLLFVAFALFHAVLVGRQRFGSVGFNHVYDFGVADRLAAQSALELFFSANIVSCGSSPFFQMKSPNIHDGVSPTAASRTDNAFNSRVPWDALTTVVASIHYGGHVTDEFDMRCITATFGCFAGWMACDEAAGDFLDIKAEWYRTPPPCDGPNALDALRQYAEALPSCDDPEVFGVHENVDVILRHRQAHEILRLLQSTQSATLWATPSLSNAKMLAGGSPDDPLLGMGLRHGDLAAEEPCQRVLTQLQQEIPWPRDDLDAFIHSSSDQWLAAFLSRELASFNTLLRTIQDSLRALSDVLSGDSMTSEDLDAMSKAFREGRVPETWRAAAYPSRRALASWSADLCQRIAWFWQWAGQRDPPICHWLSYFIFPRAFFTSILQGFSGGCGVNLEDLEFTHVVQSAINDPSEVTNPPMHGVYTFGTYIEGGRWDIHSHQIEDCRPGALSSRMPVVHFLPRPHGLPTWVAPNFTAAHTIQTPPTRGNSPTHSKGSSANLAASEVTFGCRAMAVTGRYRCPLYRTALRAGALSSSGKPEGLVCTVILPTAANPAKWILRGVALVCEPDD